MPQAHPIYTNFTAGELSPRLYGRPDLAKYANSAKELTNFTIQPQGGARRRGGSRYVCEVKDSPTNPNAILQEFIFNTQQAYMLEFGTNYVRFVRDRVQLTDKSLTITAITNSNPAHVTVPAHGLATGDCVFVSGVSSMPQINNVEGDATVIDANTIALELDSTAMPAYAGGGKLNRIYEVYTVYGEDDLPGLHFEMTGDILYICHTNWPTALLERFGDTNWTMTWAQIVEGPFLDFNIDMTNTISIDVGSGSGIMTATKDTFQAAHLGAWFKIWEQSNGGTFGYATWAPGSQDTVGNNTFWEFNGNVYYVVSGGGGLMQSTATNPTHTEGTVDVYYGGGTAALQYQHSGYCLARIDKVVDSKNCNVSLFDKYMTPYTAYGARSTPQWQEGAFSDLRGYPRIVQFHEQRLILASTAWEPQKIWGSQSGTYLNFKVGALDADAYVYKIRGQNVIQSMSSGKTMAILTSGAEFVMQSSSLYDAITPTNVRIHSETSFGTAPVRPVRIGNVVIFVQRAGDPLNPGQKLREYVYQFQTDSYLAPDLMLISEHLSEPGILQITYQATQDGIIWCVRPDGILLSITYERDQQVVAPARQVLGGNEMKVLHAKALPGDFEDEVFLIVERKINGVYRRYIEYLEYGLTDLEPPEEAVFLDASVTYEGAPVKTISGINHLNGETVMALADGIARGPYVVTGGAITLPIPASLVHIGFNYVSRLVTNRLDVGSQGGSAQGRLKRVSQVIARFWRTIGGRIGRDDDPAGLLPIKTSKVEAPLDTEIALFSGDKIIDFPGNWDRDAYITIEQDQPYPMTVSAIMPMVRGSN